MDDGAWIPPVPRLRTLVGKGDALGASLVACLNSSRTVMALRCCSPTFAATRNTMTPDASRWRSSETYDYLDSLDAPDLAWEWLRRNPEYQEDWAHAYSPTLKSDLHRTGGLQFFRLAVADCWRAYCVVVRRGGYQRSVAYARANHSADGRQPIHRAARNNRALGRARRAFPPQCQRPDNSFGAACLRRSRHPTRRARAA